MAYIYYNPNPKGRNVGDCVYRAISKVMNQSWDCTYVGLSVQGFINCNGPESNEVWNDYLVNHGFMRKAIPNTCPHCYTVRDFSHDHPYGSYIVATGSHAVAVADGNYFDSWDSGDEIPLYYYERK